MRLPHLVGVTPERYMCVYVCGYVCVCVRMWIYMGVRVCGVTPEREGWA